MGVVVIAGCLGNYLGIAGIEFVYLSIASLLNNTFPIIVIIVAFFVLKEKLDLKQKIGISFAFLGMLTMTLSSLDDSEDST